jgi:MFS family permease
MNGDLAKDQNKRVFFLVMVLIFTDTLLYGAVVPLIPFYTKQFQLNSLTIGVVFAAYSLGLLVFSIPLGLIAERYGYKKVFGAGMLGLALTTMLYGAVNGPWMLLASRFTQGVAAAASWTAGLAMVALLYPRQQGEKLGLVMAAMGLGTILGPPAGGVLYHFLGYRGMFTLLAVFCLILSLVVLKADFGPLAGGNGNAGFSARGATKNTGLIWLGVVVVISSSSVGMLEILLPNYFDRRFELDSLQIGLLFGVMGLVHAFSDVGVGILSDRYGYAPFIYWGLITSAVCLPFLALAPGLIPALAVMILLGITLGAALTPSQPLMYHVVAAGRDRGQEGGAGLAYGIFNTCFSLGLLVGPALGGVLDNFFGILAGLSFFGAVIMLTAVLFRYKVEKYLSTLST